VVQTDGPHILHAAQLVRALFAPPKSLVSTKSV